MTHVRIAGTAIALTNMFVMLGGNLFQPVIGKLLDMGWAGTMLQGSRIYEPHAYQWAFSVLPVSAVIAIVLAFFVRETHGQILSDKL
jgi:hypothetical protein